MSSIINNLSSNSGGGGGIFLKQIIPAKEEITAQTIRTPGSGITFNITDMLAISASAPYGYISYAVPANSGSLSLYVASFTIAVYIRGNLKIDSNGVSNTFISSGSYNINPNSPGHVYCDTAMEHDTFKPFVTNVVSNASYWIITIPFVNNISIYVSGTGYTNSSGSYNVNVAASLTSPVHVYTSE